MTIIADDLTGANDAAVQFRKQGYRSLVLVDCGHEPLDLSPYLSWPVVSVNTDTRAVSTDIAYNRVLAVSKACARVRSGWIYKKVDSLLRGNPGRELDAVMDGTSMRLAFLAPAYPANGRTLVEGNLRCGSFSVNAYQLFSSQMNHRVAHVAIAAVRLGGEPLMKEFRRLEAEGFVVFLFDSETERDLQNIATLSGSVSENKVLCGSAGFAQALVQDDQNAQELPIKMSRGVTLFIIGTQCAQTRVQLEYLSRHISVGQVVFHGEREDVVGESSRCVREASKLAKTHAVIIITTSGLFSSTPLVLKESVETYGRQGIVSRTLGFIAASIVERSPVCSLVLSGGDTAFQVLKNLHAECIEPLDEVAPGIPSGQVLGGRADKKLIFTKSGSFGPDDIFLTCLDRIRHEKGEC